MKKFLLIAILLGITLTGCVSTVPITQENREKINKVYIHPDIKYVTTTMQGTRITGYRDVYKGQKALRSEIEKALLNALKKDLSTKYKVVEGPQKETADATVMVTISQYGTFRQNGDRTHLSIFSSMYNTNGKIVDSLIAPYTGHNSYSKCHRKLKDYLIWQKLTIQKEPFQNKDFEKRMAYPSVRVVGGGTGTGLSTATEPTLKYFHTKRGVHWRFKVTAEKVIARAFSTFSN